MDDKKKCGCGDIATYFEKRTGEYLCVACVAFTIANEGHANLIDLRVGDKERRSLNEQRYANRK